MAQQLGGDRNEFLGSVERGGRQGPRDRPVEDDFRGPVLPQGTQVGAQPGLDLPRPGARPGVPRKEQRAGKDLVQVLGGEVTASNQDGGGALFTVTLPT